MECGVFNKVLLKAHTSDFLIRDSYRMRKRFHALKSIYIYKTSIITINYVIYVICYYHVFSQGSEVILFYFDAKQPEAKISLLKWLVIDILE